MWNIICESAIPVGWTKQHPWQDQVRLRSDGRLSSTNTGVSRVGAVGFPCGVYSNSRYKKMKYGGTQYTLIKTSTPDGQTAVFSFFYSSTCAGSTLASTLLRALCSRSSSRFSFEILHEPSAMVQRVVPTKANVEDGIATCLEWTLLLLRMYQFRHAVAAFRLILMLSIELPNYSMIYGKNCLNSILFVTIR